MKNYLEVQKKLVPDLLEVMSKRFTILKAIHHLQPVGRRSLALSMDMTERTLRSEVEYLKDLGLVSFNTVGMTLSAEGENIFENLSDVMKNLMGISEMESALMKKFSLKEVVVIAGDCDESPLAKDDLGLAAAQKLQQLLEDNLVISLTGGSTLAKVAEMYPTNSKHSVPENLTFVPARGGVGRGSQYQASTICEHFAEKLNGTCRELYIPEQLSETTIHALLAEPEIHETVRYMKETDLILHGLGDAKTMASKRKMRPEDMAKLIEAKAVGEVFGQYYDASGRVVHRIQSIGLQIADLSYAKNVVSVAGGKSKAKAIYAFLKMTPVKPILITDEAAANQLLSF